MSQFGESKYGITKFVRANSINEIRPKVEQALKFGKSHGKLF